MFSTFRAFDLLHNDVLPSLDELHAIHILLTPPPSPSMMPFEIYTFNHIHTLVVILFRLTLVLTHKLANGITLSANIMSIVLLYKYSGGQQGPSPRFPSEQCFVCRDEGYESIRCSTPTPEEIASILAPCHSMASSRSCLLSCRANCIPMYKLKSIMSTVHADCCIFTRHPDSYSSIQINGGVVDIISTLIFDRRAGQRQPLLALQMVKFSSLHDEGRPVEVLYH